MNYNLDDIEYAKDKGKIEGNLKSRRNRFFVQPSRTEMASRNPYEVTGNHGKKLKAAWHNACMAAY